jgi:hypothetical protein
MPRDRRIVSRARRALARLSLSSVRLFDQSPRFRNHLIPAPVELQQACLVTKCQNLPNRQDPFTEQNSGSALK